MAEGTAFNMSTPSSANEEAIRAWDGPLYERFVQFRHLLTGGLAGHGDEALRLHPPRPGERVLDVGCGFGDATQQIAALVGPDGHALGVDAAERFIETAREETAALGIANAGFEVADVQAGVPEGPFDMAFSRFGTMFFANPVVALRNVRDALVPEGRLVMVVWRTRTDNEWLYRAQTIVERIVKRPDEYEEPTCGPGPFSMAGADTVSDVLLHAGYGEVELRRCELPILIGVDLEEAIDMVMAMGPAGEILRLLGDRAAHLHDTVREALREGMADMVTPEGVMGSASTWIVSARAAA
jgi:ubiquinone/menaquinone biosynthesis C-methylase UbiE